MRLLLLTLLLPALLFAERGFVEPWGKDEHLSFLGDRSTQTRAPLSSFGKFAEQAILFHTNVLSHTTAPQSHFRPSSSQYMLEAIRRYGFLKGYIMGCDRLMRENGDPWHYRNRLVGGKLYKSDDP